MNKKDSVKEALTRMITTNKRMAKSNHNCNQNVQFVGDANVLEKQLLLFCNESKIHVKIIDVLEEDKEQKTNLLDLFDELQKDCSLLYLKNYTKTRPNVRYKFSYVYKDQCVNDVIKKENLQYLGTVIISSEDDLFKLDDSESSCFRHISY